MRLLLVSLALLSAVHAPAWADGDAKATAIGKEVWNALGGDAGWNQARYLRFDFIVERGGKQLVKRAHYWDRFSGRYRVDGVDDKGARYRVYFNVGTRVGEAWVNDVKLTDVAQAKKRIDEGYEAFINDSYWLLAPYKLFDAGVNLSYAGEDKGPSGEACDVLKLSFGSVGLTPKDIYWQLVDRASHRVVEWRFVLDGGKGPPSAFAWSDWHKVGSIQLASTRTALGKPSAIRFGELAVSSTPDDAALTPPR